MGSLGDAPLLQVLGMVRSRVLSHKAGVPAATQAEVLSDAVLSQVRMGELRP